MIKNIVDKVVSNIHETYKKKIDPIKEEVRLYIDEKDFTKIEAVIHSASVSAAAASAAMAQGAAFGLDTPVLITIHIGMIITLGEVFGRKINKSTAAALLGAAAGVGIGVFGVKAVLGFIPIGGNIVNSAVSFGYTELLGWTFVKYFKGDKDTVQRFNIEGKGVTMGDTYTNIGQAAAMGPGANVSNNIFQQLQPQLVAEQLSQLKNRMQGRADSPEQREATENVSHAEQSARNGDELKMLEHLKRAGKWALKQAEEIGTQAAVELIKKSMEL